MSKRDYYEVLGLEKTADENAIKQAYRRLAMKYHPDRNPEDPQAEDKFKEASEAFDVLSNGEKRSQYDRFGHSGIEGMQQGFDPFANGSNLADILNNLDSMFGDMFAGATRRATSTGRSRGDDLSYRLTIDLEQAVTGDKVQVSVPALRTCSDCDGTGAERGTSRKTCPDCGGSGMLQERQNFFVMQRTCRRCRGQGSIIEKPCYTCSGQGRLNQHKTLSISIPPGVDQDTTLRVSNEGHAGVQGGQPGDLFIQFVIRSHPVFERSGDHLICEIPITFTQAALGAEIDIPTMSGNVQLRIPSETQTGKLFRLRGRGVPSLRGSSRGDLLCRVVVETPVKLSNRQRELLEELEKSCTGTTKNTPQGHKFFRAIKEFFDKITS